MAILTPVGTWLVHQQTSSSGTHHRAMLKACIQANPPLGTSLPYVCLSRIPAWTYYQMIYTGYFSKGSKQAWILEKHKRLAIYFDYQSLASDDKKYRSTAVVMDRRTFFFSELHRSTAKCLCPEESAVFLCAKGCNYCRNTTYNHRLSR